MRALIDAAIAGEPEPVFAAKRPRARVAAAAAAARADASAEQLRPARPLRRRPGAVRLDGAPAPRASASVRRPRTGPSTLPPVSPFEGRPAQGAGQTPSSGGSEWIRLVAYLSRTSGKGWPATPPDEGVLRNSKEAPGGSVRFRPLPVGSVEFRRVPPAAFPPEAPLTKSPSRLRWNRFHQKTQPKRPARAVAESGSLGFRYFWWNRFHRELRSQATPESRTVADCHGAVLGKRFHQKYELSDLLQHALEQVAWLRNSGGSASTRSVALDRAQPMLSPC